MFLVAVATLGSSLEAELPHLAADLGSTVYEARLMLVRGLPAVVQRSPDKDRALELLKRLRARGHQAVAFDQAAVVPRAGMVHPRDLRFDDDALRSDHGELPYATMLVLIRGSQPTREESSYTTSHRKLDVPAAVVTGGLKLMKKVKQEHKIVTRDREQLLFVYPRSGGPPWVLEEHGIHYQCLGADMTTHHMENFQRVVKKLRERASGAQYDESLVSFAKAGHDKLGERAIDEQAHVIALCAARGLLHG